MLWQPHFLLTCLTCHSILCSHSCTPPPQSLVSFRFILSFIFVCPCQVPPGHRPVHLLPSAHLPVTHQALPLSRPGPPRPPGRPPGPPPGPRGPRLTPLLMALRLPSLLRLNACLRKVPARRGRRLSPPSQQGVLFFCSVFPGCV